MRISIFTSAYTLGGAEKHAFLLADYFKNQMGLPTEFCVIYRGTGELETRCKNAGIEARIVGPFKEINRKNYFLRRYTEAKKLSGFNADVLMSFNLRPNLLNAMLGKKAGAKCTVWTQQTADDCGMLTPFQQEAVSGCSCYISNSQHGADYITNKFSLNPEKVFVVKNGFDKAGTIKHDKNYWWQKIGLTPKQFKIAMIAHIEERKDHESLLKAWKIVVDKYRNVPEPPVLLLAGKMGAETARLHQLAMELDIYPFVKFLGSINDPQGLYNSVDACVFYSKIEGVPNSLVEAMYQKLPVVANDIPGNVEALGTGNAAWIAKTGDLQAFAEKIICLIENPQLKQEAGLFNFQYATNEYSFEKLGRETYHILEKQLAGL